MIVIAFENQSYATVLGAGAPASEFTKLAGECGVATRFTAVHFPHSLPTYIASTSGQVSITGDCLPGPSCQSGAANIFSQLGPSQWRTFGQSMPSNCAKTNSGNYVTRHLPALYYTRISAATCAADALPLPTTFGATKRKFVWIAPDQMSDMETGDAGSGERLARRTSSRAPPASSPHAPYTAGHTAVFIWFDTGANGDTVSTAAALHRHQPVHAAHPPVGRPERLQRAAGVGAHAGRAMREQRLHGDPHGRRLPPGRPRRRC